MQRLVPALLEVVGRHGQRVHDEEGRHGLAEETEGSGAGGYGGSSNDGGAGGDGGTGNNGGAGGEPSSGSSSSTGGGAGGSAPCTTLDFAPMPASPATNTT